MSKGVVGPEPDHLTKEVAGLRRLAAAQQGPRQAPQGQAAAWAHTRGNGEVPDCVLGTTRDQEFASQVGVHPKVVAVDRLGPPQDRDRQITASEHRQRAGKAGDTRPRQTADGGRVSKSFQDF
jgi:hypothetical protein